MEKVIIAEKTFKNDWFNITDNKGREISVFVGKSKEGKDSNPTLKAPLEAAKSGDEVEMDVKPGKDGVKLFGWEAKTGGGFGGKSFAPKDKSFDAGIAAISAAAAMYGLQKDTPIQTVLNAAESFHAFIMSKETKLKTETK